MELDRNQKTLIGIVLITVAMAAIVFTPTVLTNSIPLVCMSGDQCQHEQFVESLITYVPLIFASGIALGAVSFYFLYDRKKPAVEEKDVSEIIGVLEKTEAILLHKIVSEGGRVLQAELSRLDGVGKVKAHRIIQRLKKRGVLETEGAGKTNVVKLTEKYRKLFVD
ncbi:MAG: hypothetical protein ABIG39_01880 [Candidatus Micrarchaeota archaeon]